MTDQPKTEFWGQEPVPSRKEESVSGGRSSFKSQDPIPVCFPKKRQKNIAKKLDKNRVSKYINKAPEEKRFTQKRAEPRKNNSLKA